MTVWFDDGMARVQALVDKALPGRTNQLKCGKCSSSRYIVVDSSSDREPGEYLLFDRQAATLQPIARSRPWLDERTQGTRTFHRVPTRDGLQMPVVVTHPAGASPTDPLPAVVLVHGGPYVRGADTGWSSEAQFLAARGYRVIEPSFRGTTGYGFKLFRAGWQQWGLAMQDDLVDALNWAADRKLVDKGRACIMGASYGGYAALMGPVRHPDAWRCAISYAGVTDIETMFTSRDSDLSEDAKRYDLKTLIGDPAVKSTEWQAVSPLRQVARIKVPVLLAHGEWDWRVPPAHAGTFARAAKAAGVNVDYVKYDRNAHNWQFWEDHADFLRRVDAFLAKSLPPSSR